MDKNRCEVFGQLLYDESLTYEELLEIEKQLINRVNEILQWAGAVHIDFTPHGDDLLFQCAFEAYSGPVFQDIAQNLAAVLPAKISGRIMGVDKNDFDTHIFWIRPGVWQEYEQPVAEHAPEGCEEHLVLQSASFELGDEVADSLADGQTGDQAGGQGRDGSATG